MADNKLLPVPMTAEQITWLKARLVEIGNDTVVSRTARLADQIIQTLDNSLIRQGGR